MQGALEWLEENQDKPIDEVRAAISSKASTADPASASSSADPVAASLICNECQKKFRSTNDANYHAEKSGHTDFSESVETIAPLTDEEKKAKLADLRDRLKAKREGQGAQDKLDQKRNEEIRRKSTKETQDIKEDLQKKEQLKQAEKKRKEKADDVRAKDEIRRKIAEDKEARRLKAEAEKAAREGRPVPAPASTSEAVAPTPSAPTTSKPASAYTETRLRLQTSSGNVLKTFPVDATLFEVATALSQESGIDVESFVQNFPKKTFDAVDFGSSLKELGLVPSASLIVQ